MLVALPGIWCTALAQAGQGRTGGTHGPGSCSSTGERSEAQQQSSLAWCPVGQCKMSSEIQHVHANMLAPVGCHDSKWTHDSRSSKLRSTEQLTPLVYPCHTNYHLTTRSGFVIYAVPYQLCCSTNFSVVVHGSLYSVAGSQACERIIYRICVANALPRHGPRSLGQSTARPGASRVVTSSSVRWWTLHWRQRCELGVLGAGVAVVLHWPIAVDPPLSICPGYHDHMYMPLMTQQCFSDTAHDKHASFSTLLLLL